MELLVDLNERDGTALVAVLHDLGLAAHFFPRLVVIDHGRIVADGPPRGGPHRRPDPRRVQRRAGARPPRRDRGPRLTRGTASWAPCGSPSSSWNGSSPATSSRCGTCCAPRTWRAGGWPTSSTRADDEARALWDGLTLGYTEAPGHPLLRAEIASLYETIAPDEVLTFSGAEEAIYVAANVLLGPGDHAIVDLARVPEPPRGRPRDRRRRDPPRAPGERGLGDRRRAAARAGDAADEADRRQRAAQPDRDAPRRGDVPRGRGDRRRGGATLFSDEVYRFLEVDPATRLPAGADVGRARREPRRDVQVVRDGRAADRLARDARPAAARGRGPLQGLPDDLLVGAVRDPRPDRPPRPRPGHRPQPRDHRRRTSRCSTASSSARPRTSRGSGRGAARSASRS